MSKHAVGIEWLCPLSSAGVATGRGVETFRGACVALVWRRSSSYTDAFLLRLARCKANCHLLQFRKVIMHRGVDGLVASIFFDLASIDGESLPALVERLREAGLSRAGDELDHLSALPNDRDFRLTGSVFKAMLTTETSQPRES